MKRGLVAMGVVLMCRGAAAETLADPGFESGQFGAWAVNGQDWRLSADAADAHGTGFAAVNDVLTNNVDAYRVLHQEFPVAPGTRCSGGAWVKARNVESTESYFEIQFWDRYGVTIKQHQSDYVNKDHDYRYLKIERAVAPPEAFTVSVRCVVHMTEAPRTNADVHVFDDVEFTMVAPGG